MVYRQGERVREREKLVERSKPLHNFPMDLKWGNRKLLRCMSIDSNGEPAPAMTGDHRRVAVETGIEALRKELITDLHSKANKMKNVLREGLEKEEEREIRLPPPPPPPVKSPADGGAEKPWNLRSRRAACKATMINGGGNVDGGRSLKPNNSSPLRNESRSPDSGAIAGTDQKRDMAKFLYTLSRSEIEQDFLAMTGHKLPRRPKKRPRAVQKILENLAPAMWLTEVHSDHYKVPDAPENGKR